MTDESTTFRTLDVTVPDGTGPTSVTPVYLEDRKQRIAIARVDGRLVAFDDLCTCTDEARHCPLSAGGFDGKTILCQCHGSTWDLLTGAVTRGPAKRPLVLHQIREDGDRIDVRV